jgi:hypothetical protein
MSLVEIPSLRFLTLDSALQAVGQNVGRNSMASFKLLFLRRNLRLWRCCQSNANRSPHDALGLARRGAHAARLCHSARAAERRCL